MNEEPENEMESYFGEPDDGPDEQDISTLPSLDDMDAKKADASVEPSDYTQHLLLSYLISAPELWIKCAPIIDAKYFDPQYRPVIANVIAHLKQYGDMPDPEMIHSETGVLLDTKEDAGKESRQTYVCDKVEEFCRTTAFQDFLLDSAEVTATDRSRSTLSGLMKKAASIEQMSLTRNLGIEVHTGTVEILTKAEKDDNITTGFSLMDRAFSGGLTRPSFNIVSCASGDGKSIYLQNQLVNYIEQGMNVIFYTLELEPAIVIKRFAAMMTNTHIDHVYTHLDTIGHTMYTRGKTDGALWVKKFPMVGTTMADISAHYLELTMHSTNMNKGIPLKYGAVAIDYIDVMDSVEKIDKSNIHIKDKMVSHEMNDWAHKNELILWSASQQTKGAQDEKDPRQSGVGGGVDKVHTCDNLLIGKRSDEDIEDERWWAHVGKARSSGATKTKIPFYWNSQTMRMSDGDPDIFEQANPKLFGRKRVTDNTPDLIKNDPLAQEQGIDVEEKTVETGQKAMAVSAFAQMRGMTHQQQELKDDASE
jgi:hypothetical protein